VLYGKTADDIPNLRSKIQDELRVFTPNKTHELERLRVD
jgi:hypothetical protein